MKAGRTINGYTLTTDLKTAGGGQCVWGFARKDGVEYFIKQFLSPKYPTPDSPGSPETKALKLARCQAFERHHMELWKALDAVRGGNLIVTHEFFRDGPKYYKVTERVDTRVMPLDRIAKLGQQQKIILLRSILSSVSRLHAIGVVHGDLKPANILTFTTDSGMISAKLIDFDNAYRAGEPDENTEDVIGDTTYYSPEAYRYIMQDAAARREDLSFPSDIFALGIVFTQYLTGSRPAHALADTVGIAQAVIAGQSLTFGPTGMPPHVDRIIQSMLHVAPSGRPNVEQLLGALALEDKGFVAPVPQADELARITAPVVREPSSDGAEPAPPPSAPPPTPHGGLRVRMGSSGEPRPTPTDFTPVDDVHTPVKAPTPAPAPPAAPTTSAPSRLRGTLLRRKSPTS